MVKDIHPVLHCLYGLIILTQMKPLLLLDGTASTGGMRRHGMMLLVWYVYPCSAAPVLSFIA